jgi:hypothetical protein
LEKYLLKYLTRWERGAILVQQLEESAMSLELEKAVESLEAELQNTSLRIMEIKKTINQLLFLSGDAPRYTDIESEAGAGKSEIQPRQFVGKDMLPAVKEIMRGKKTSMPQEILESLEIGDFDFPADWKAKLKLKNLAIYLGSRKEDFVWFDTKAGKVYALAEQYPERKRELDKLSNKKSATQEANDSNKGEESEPKKRGRPKKVIVEENVPEEKQREEK